MERYALVPRTRPKPPSGWSLYLKGGYRGAVLGTTILSRTGAIKVGYLQRWSQIFLSNRTRKWIVRFEFSPKFPKLWAEWKALIFSRPVRRIQCIVNWISLVVPMIISSHLNFISVRKTFSHFGHFKYIYIYIFFFKTNLTKVAVI